MQVWWSAIRGDIHHLLRCINLLQHPQKRIPIHLFVASGIARLHPLRNGRIHEGPHRVHHHIHLVYLLLIVLRVHSAANDPIDVFVLGVDGTWAAAGEGRDCGAVEGQGAGEVAAEVARAADYQDFFGG